MSSKIVAAMDLGSNSFHLGVVRVGADRQITPIVKEKEMLRLGEAVAADGYFDAVAIEQAIATVERFEKLARAHGAEHIVAQATAAFREAENGPEAVAEITKATGVPIRVISGHEEAETIFFAIRSACHFGTVPAVGADLGGGSLELTLGDQRQLFMGRSLRVGVGRLKVRHPLGDPASPASVQRLREHLAEEMGSVLDDISSFQPTRLILTSGTFLALGRLAISMAKEHDSGEDGLLVRRVSADSLRSATAKVLATPEAKRGQLAGVDVRRQETVAYGAVVAELLLDQLDVEEIWLCSWALREGMVLREIEERDLLEFAFEPSEMRTGSLDYLVKKYQADSSHSEQVARLSRLLFDLLSSTLKLDEGEFSILRAAAKLHDIGNFVSITDHDRHGAYLIKADPPRGYARRELSMIEMVVAGHVKGELAESPDLGRHDVDTCRKLVAILRVADALDRSHQQLVKGIEGEIRPTGLGLKVVGSGDMSAEGFALRKKRRLLEEVLQTNVSLHLVET